jgi:tetratricopeptide (TPR) repeat protein
MQCLVEAFPELETDSKAHIISFEAHLRIGIFLLGTGSEEASLAEFNKCLSLAKTNLERCKAFRQIAEVYSLQERYEEGCKVLESVFELDLGTDEDALNLIKDVHAARGGIYQANGEYARALEAYEAASTNKAGRNIDGILECLHNLRRHEAILEKISSWDASTRDEWLLDTLPRFLTIFHIAIKRMERSPFLSKCYTEAIKRSRFTQATYLHWLKLADAYWHVLDQPEKALKIYDRVFQKVAKELRSYSDLEYIYQWRNARSNFTLLLCEAALDAKACDHDHILQHLLHITVDFTMKAADMDDYWSQSDDRAQNLLCARIYKLLGKTTEARKILDYEFRLAIDLLEDNIGSNDIYAFNWLTQCLAVVGCKEEARLAYSLSFSNVDPQSAAQQEKDTEDDSDEEEESKALGDEDLVHEIRGCDGCSKGFRNFAESLYKCLICPNVDLCTACYTDHMADKNGLAGLIGYAKFCNPIKHEYLKAPVNGWKGVKDGVIRYDGKEVRFTVWLEDLKEMWKNLEL